MKGKQTRTNSGLKVYSMPIRTIDECFYHIQNGANIKQGDVDGGYPITRIETTSNDTFNRDRMGYAGITDLSKYESYILEDGDLLMSHINSVQYLGRTVLYKKIDGETIIHGMNLLRLKANRGIIKPDYARYAFYSYPFRSQLANITKKSVNQASFAVKDLKRIKLNIPDLSVQADIVSTLDKLQSIITHRKQQLEKLDELIKARFVEMFGEPIDNPMGWQNKPLKELSTLITNGNTPKGGSENYVDSGIIFLRSQNVWRNRIDLSEVAYIDEATNQKMRKSIVKHKDILITKTGRINTENSSLGRAALYLGQDDSANINGHVYLVRLNDSVVPEFVVTILTGEAYRKYIRKVCVGGIDKRQINLDQVEEFPIILPPIEQQKAFADFSNQINKSKVAVQKALDEAQLLFDSLMQEYFG